MARGLRLRWLVAIAVAGAILYFSSFMLLRYIVLPSYELSKFPERHWIRPTYEPFYYPLRWLQANGWSPALPPPKVRTGKLAEVIENKMVFDYGRRAVHIGFVCAPSACADLKQVKRGDEVEATFGVTLASGRDTFINKLLAVRVCKPADPQCAMTLERQRAEELEDERLIEASTKKQQLRYEAMERTLANDSRYVPRPREGTPIDDAIRNRFNALDGDKRACSRAFVDAHRQAVFESCTAHKCGANIGGGCWHIADPIHSEVITRAVEKCGT